MARQLELLNEIESDARLIERWWQGCDERTTKVIQRLIRNCEELTNLIAPPPVELVPIVEINETVRQLAEAIRSVPGLVDKLLGDRPARQ